MRINWKVAAFAVAMAAANWCSAADPIKLTVERKNNNNVLGRNTAMVAVKQPDL